MANGMESMQYDESQTENTHSSGWLKWGVIAAASALAGGLAAAWWYRKTLATLRQADENGTNPQYGNFGEDASDDA
jgi:hypothetical protein